MDAPKICPCGTMLQMWRTVFEYVSEWGKISIKEMLLNLKKTTIRYLFKRHLIFYLWGRMKYFICLSKAFLSSKIRTCCQRRIGSNKIYCLKGLATLRLLYVNYDKKCIPTFKSSVGFFQIVKTILISSMPRLICNSAECMLATFCLRMFNNDVASSHPTDRRSNYISCSLTSKGQAAPI